MSSRITTRLDEPQEREDAGAGVSRPSAILEEQVRQHRAATRPLLHSPRDEHLVAARERPRNAGISRPSAFRRRPEAANVGGDALPARSREASVAGRDAPDQRRAGVRRQPVRAMRWSQHA
jgi:hypothetical protein